MFSQSVIPVVFISLFLIGLALVGTILWKKTEKWHHLLWIFTISVLVGLLPQFVPIDFSLPLVDEQNYFVALTVISSGVVFCIITHKFTRSLFSWRLWLPTFLLVFIVGMSVGMIYKGGLIYSSGINIRNMSALFWGFLTLPAILNIYVTYKKSYYSLHRNRLKYYVVVLIIYVLSSGLIIFLNLVAGFSLLIAVATGLTFINLKYDLPDIRERARKILSNSLAYLLGGGIYCLILSIPLLLFQARLFSLVVGSIIILGFVTVVTISPAFSLLRGWLEKKIYGRRIDRSIIIANYSKEVANIIEMGDLAQKIVDIVTTEFNLKYGALFLVRKKEGSYFWNLIYPYSPTLCMEGFSLSSNSTLVHRFANERAPLTQYDLDFHPQMASLESNLKNELANLKMDLFLPIYTQNNWAGVLALGPKKNGDRFYDHEVTTLKLLTDQTSVAFRNAQLYEDLRDQNREVERLYAELSIVNVELERLDLAKSDFISIASHEIRTPLTQIIGYNDILAEMMKGGNIPRTAGLQMVEGVQKAARRLEGIVNTMFDVTQLDTKTLDLHFGEINLVNLIQNVVERWMLAIEDRHLTLTMKGLSSLPIIDGDTKRLEQVFSNLLQNAIKYTPDGGSIHIQGLLDPSFPHENSESIEILVTDTGIGINGADLERIFAKFYRIGNVMLHSSGETKFKGAGPGLGLTIARGIVDGHGGKLWAESQGYDEQKCPGSSFHVILPVKQPAKN